MSSGFAEEASRTRHCSLLPTFARKTNSGSLQQPDRRGMPRAMQAFMSSNLHGASLPQMGSLIVELLARALGISAGIAVLIASAVALF